jgi:small subunit ribosomal protein S6
MKPRTYECVLVLDPGLDAEKITGQLERFQEQILHHGGLIRKWDRWGKKRLAYEIDGKQYGYYVIVVFDLDPAAVKPMDRYARLNQLILRHLIVLVEPRRVPEIEPTADLRSGPEISREEPPSVVGKKEEKVEPSATTSDEPDEAASAEDSSESNSRIGESDNERSPDDRGTA